MIISHEHRFIFLKTLKTAGTSVEIALSRCCGPDDVVAPLAAADERLRRDLGGRPAQHYESPPLRHRARAHTRAWKAREIVGGEVWDDYLKVTVERNPWDAVVSLYHWLNRRTTRYEDFAAFLDDGRAEALAERNYQVYHLGGRVAADRVLAFEDLATGVAGVWHELGLPGSPELASAKSSRERRGYREHYTAAQADRVAEAFAPVIRERGYTF